MNPFLQSTKRMLALQGSAAQFKKVQTGSYDPETGSVTNTETSFNIKTYKKDAMASQYKYPNLVGKEIAEFFILASELTSEPRPQDKIVFQGTTFTVDAVSLHYARGEVVLYCCIAVRG